MKKLFDDLGMEIDYDEFNRVFEISSIEDDKLGIFTKMVVREMNVKLRGYLNYLDPLVNSMPQTFYQMVVYKNVSDEDKKKAVVYYKAAMDLYHRSLIVETKSDEEIKEFIKDAWSKWKSVEEGTMNVLEICRLVWVKEDKQVKSSKEYLG